MDAFFRSVSEIVVLFVQRIRLPLTLTGGHVATQALRQEGIQVDHEPSKGRWKQNDVCNQGHLCVVACVLGNHYDDHAWRQYLPQTDSNLSAEICHSAPLRAFPQDLQVFSWIAPWAQPRFFEEATSLTTSISLYTKEASHKTWK